MIGTEAAEVLRELVVRDLGIPSDHRLEFMTHPVGVNWRQRHTSPRQKIEALEESLRHGPRDTFLLEAGDRAGLAEHLRRAGGRRLALSVTSRVWDAAGGLAGHLALMNLHPEGFRGAGELAEAVRLTAGGTPGYLLESGRYFHYYGRRLLTGAEWQGFLAQFLMPCVLVSPRYIGHSLDRGFCTLRLNAAPGAKPMVPRVVSVLERMPE